MSTRGFIENERDRQFVELAFKNVDTEYLSDLNPSLCEKFKGCKDYYEWDKKLSSSQVKMVKDAKRMYDLAKSRQRQKEQSWKDNDDMFLNRKYNPISTFR